jgi:hypothetical protein
MNKSSVEFIECAGKNCNSNAVEELTIAFLDMRGYFCNECKKALLNDDLVLENEGNKKDDSVHYCGNNRRLRVDSEK